MSRLLEHTVSPFRTSAAEVESTANLIKIVSDNNLVEEHKLENTFKYEDIFNDLSLHTFTNPSRDLVSNIQEPTYKASEFL